MLGREHFLEVQDILILKRDAAKIENIELIFECVNNEDECVCECEVPGRP